MQSLKKDVLGDRLRGSNPATFVNADSQPEMDTCVGDVARSSARAAVLIYDKQAFMMDQGGFQAGSGLKSAVEVS